MASCNLDTVFGLHPYSSPDVHGCRIRRAEKAFSLHRSDSYGVYYNGRLIGKLRHKYYALPASKVLSVFAHVTPTAEDPLALRTNWEEWPGGPDDIEGAVLWLRLQAAANG